MCSLEVAAKIREALSREGDENLMAVIARVKACTATPDEIAWVGGLYREYAESKIAARSLSSAA